jgi:hypothetical protein
MINFNELSKCTSDDFYKVYSESIVDCKEEIKFVQREKKSRYGAEYILPSEYTYEYNKIYQDRMRRLVIVKVNNDKVFIVLKRVQMFQSIYNRIEGIPISYLKNQNTELKVLKEISENKLAQKIGVNEIEEATVKKYYQFSEKIQSYNFYSNIKNNFEKIDKNKWKHKKGINKLLKMTNLTFKVLKNEGALDYENVLKDKEDINKLNLAWEKYKKEIDKVPKGWIRLKKAMAKYSYWNDNFTFCYLFKYKDIPVAYVVYILDNKVCYQIINKTVGRSLYDNLNLNEEEQKEFDEIKKKISAYVHYKTIEDMKKRNVTDAFFGGSFSLGKLDIYKTIMNDKQISHYVYKL